MKKIMMTICGVAFMSMIALAQQVDSTQNKNGSTDFRNNPIQDSAMAQPVNPQPIEGTPRTQDPTTAPVVQPQPQQSQPERQPQLYPQQQQSESPLQSQPQEPTQSQPTLDPNNTSPQLNQPVQPRSQQPTVAPSPNTPTGGGTPPR